MAETSAPALAKPRQYAKMSGPERRANVTPALEHATPKQEAHIMSHCGQYTDSAASEKTEQNENWKSIGGLARALVVGAAKKLAGQK